MSIVGTRPPLISETNLYEPHHNKKLKKSRFSAGSACRRPGYKVQLF